MTLTTSFSKLHGSFTLDLPFLKKITLLFFLAALFVPRAQAQVAAVIRQNNAVVRSEPNSFSESLVTLRAGTRVTVKGRNGNWFKVSLVSSGFEFTGWVEKSAFVATARPAPRPAPPPSSSIDQFFDPAPGRRPSPAPSRSSTSFSSAGYDSASPIVGKLRLLGDLGYAIYSHKISTAGTTPGELFKFNISGPVVKVGGQYDFWRSQDQKIVATAELSYARAFLNTKTDLQDSSNVTFDNRKAKNAINDIALKASAAYAVTPQIRASASFGFRMFNFSGDDITDNSDDPINLYVSYKLMSFPIGLGVRYLYNDQLEFGLDADVLLLSFYKEKPEDSTGTKPDPKIGLNPSLSAFYKLAPQHYVGGSYSLLFQSVAYTGAGTRVTLATTDASTDTTMHQIRLSYQYRF